MATSKDGGNPAKRPGGRRKLTDAEKKRRAKARRAAQVEAAEAARREQLSATELIAEDDAAETKAKGAERTLVNAALYRKLYRQWAEGISYEELSDMHGLSARRIREVVEDLRGTRLEQLGVGDPLFGVKLAEQLVLQRSQAVSQYARLAQEVPDEQKALKLGYLKRRDDALDKFIELMQELGFLPRHLGSLNALMDALQMAEVMLEVMDEKGVSMAVQQAVVEAIELRVVKRGNRLAVAGVGPDVMGQARDVEEGDGRAGVEPGAERSAGVEDAPGGDEGSGDDARDRAGDPGARAAA